MRDWNDTPADRNTHHDSSSDSLDSFTEAPILPGPHYHGDENQAENEFFDLFADQAAEAGLWKAAQFTADLIHPGAGHLVAIAYRAVQIIRAADGVLVGDGFIMQVGLEGIAGTGLCLALRIREGANNDQPWPDISVGVDVNFLEQLDTGTPDVDGAAPHRQQPEVKPAPPWPGEWIIEYGMQAVRNRQAVLDSRGLLNDHDLVDAQRRPTGVSDWVPVSDTPRWAEDARAASEQPPV